MRLHDEDEVNPMTGARLSSRCARVISSAWDYNGALTVDVVTAWPRTEATDQAARRAARRALAGTKQTRIVAVELIAPRFAIQYTIRASRLEK